MTHQDVCSLFVVGLLALFSPGIGAQEDPAQLTQLARAARGKDVSKRTAAIESLFSLGETGKKVLAKVLIEGDREVKEGLGRVLTGGPCQAIRAAMASELEKRRKAALAYVFNPALFRKGSGILRMEELMGKVRELWATPEQYFAARVKSLNPLLTRAEEVARFGKRAGLSSLFSFQALASVRRAAGVEKMGISSGQHKWNKEVMTWNKTDCPTSAHADELEVIRLTNEFRMMMGMRALEADERIIKAARAHSQEMEDRGYFSHTSPVPGHASFATRVKLQGYSGPMNENIAVAGSPERAFQGWYLSAGHHRNMLARGGTAIGLGRSKGRQALYKWTMNLGAGDSLRNRNLTKPALIYLQKKRKVGPGDAQGHLKLAKWCFAKGLVKEMCAECRSALRINPRLREARKLLAERFKLKKR